MVKIPKFLEKYFWDVDVKKTDVKKHKIFVLRRILEYGDERVITWMTKNYNLEEIKEFIRKDRSLSRKSGSFWALILNLPRGEVRCLKKPLSKVQKRIWPY